MRDKQPVQRRSVLKGGLGLSGMLGLGSYAPSALGLSAGMARGRAPLAPMRLSPDQLIDVKSCIRPLRAAGPNLGTEQIGDTLVVHNYGHGGSGWSLSWGSGDIAVGKAMSVLPHDIAVIGCGIVGLTSAILAQRAGMRVTIYARDFLPRTRSFRAEGAFTPDSRVALTAPAGADFPALWERMARFSWKSFRPYLGLAGKPVEFVDFYLLGDGPGGPHESGPDPKITDSYATTGLPHQNSEFLHLGDRIRDIAPSPQDLTAEENPFPVAHASRLTQMNFNFSSYGQALLQEFFERGGRFEMREFHSPGDVTTLKEKVVIHSTGYAARDLWRDTTMIPVRGQTGWLPPQPDVNYGLLYKNGIILPKADGVCVMNLDLELGEMQGVGDSFELPNREETLAAMAAVAPLFASKW